MNISYEYILYLATNIAAEYTVWKCVLLALSTEDEKILQLPYSNCSAAGGIGIPCWTVFTPLSFSTLKRRRRNISSYSCLSCSARCRKVLACSPNQQHCASYRMLSCRRFMRRWPRRHDIFLKILQCIHCSGCFPSATLVAPSLSLTSAIHTRTEMAHTLDLNSNSNNAAYYAWVQLLLLPSNTRALFGISSNS